jgi:hypothetical protein
MAGVRGRAGRIAARAPLAADDGGRPDARRRPRVEQATPPLDAREGAERVIGADTSPVRVVLARIVVIGMAALAVLVQLGVWGATKLRSDGALLESWQPYFGWRYGLAFAAAQVALCRWLRIDRGVVWLARTWAIGGALLVVAWLLGGRSGPLGFDSAVALVSGLSALVLAAGLYEGRLVPGPAAGGPRDPGRR